MDRTSFQGNLEAAFLEVGGSLWMRSSKLEHMNMSYATVRREIDMADARVDRTLDAQRLAVAGNFFARNTIADKLAMPFAQVGGNLDLVGTNIAEIDLYGASVTGELWVGDRHQPAAVGAMDLRTAHAGSLSDNKDSWHSRLLYLDGFTFAHLGGAGGDSGTEMVDRPVDWWDRWARLDGDGSSSPYEQLAVAFAAMGNRDAADEIHYDERVRADQKKNDWRSFIWSQFLRWGAGYGVGLYMFRALDWALGLSLLGALILRFCVQGVLDEKHGFLWCFGASANKLLPVVSLKKDFSDFFDDQRRNMFTPWQDIFFTVLAALGWVLGLVVVAAMATITHGA
jgi:hypothetical protein